MGSTYGPRGARNVQRRTTSCSSLGNHRCPPTTNEGLLDVVGIVTGAIALIGGIYIAIHELRRRERRITRREIDDLTRTVETLTDEQLALRTLLLEQRRYIYRLVMLMIDAGLDPPQPPAPSFDRGEYDDDDGD